mmetsp:Transcript_14686/g.24449  ORF Transcript_14686/g.24449 Transcript_14686/m.24449 type:complete len:189 (-) Transcript_14686:55-621(-)|eukprot:CAMPEP_0181045826 /NCGR_PEP_ID=MMETSP1070-20121207/14018_1 /TAXON_ID=265543 /ORGANISM="Minutocellus polymorphus, Strain NH13" /LENGTH=188 /DNA_ID=CAMNT_0023124387 /DNA_START=137 /DNA_END=700 /DNA_ORIENTATION=-
MTNSSHYVTRQPRRWDGFGVASVQEINAPPSRVWSKIIDIDSSPLILSTVESMERIDGSRVEDPVRVGTRWKQTRRGVESSKHTTIITCTALDNGGGDPDRFPKTFSITTSVPGTASTGSLSVECVEGDCSRCHLVVSFALVPQSLLSRLLFTSPIGRYFIDRTSIKHVEDDMADIAKASEKEENGEE